MSIESAMYNFEVDWGGHDCPGPMTGPCDVDIARRDKLLVSMLDFLATAEKDRVFLRHGQQKYADSLSTAAKLRAEEVTNSSRLVLIHSITTMRRRWRCLFERISIYDGFVRLPAEALGVCVAQFNPQRSAADRYLPIHGRIAGSEYWFQHRQNDTLTPCPRRERAYWSSLEPPRLGIPWSRTRMRDISHRAIT